ncbi:hypothetical protein GCM10008107_26540 [Psychrosphaera saromensis]|uniref:Uncharacterized protein n=1 Tax=Psychrosphaera saromensis TaxID=716813 RepID=A0A2S7UXH3_9GAMM|nr:hypothetical protein BTO11_10095 [Psychrosphaera saromensis]GHB75816.1 hypothetical protein GCM10008107_26540 [Psychrosphaera saromensis]GLQ14543.1 hypothetical protein GCM10007917_19980 [Psychrosphaera saromensis]
MKTDRFFKLIWNFNGLVLFIGIVTATLFISYKLFSELFKDEIVEQPILNLAQDDKKEEKWSLGYPRKIGNTDFHIIPLESEKLSVEKSQQDIRLESFGSSSYGYTPTRSKNVLLLNGNTNHAAWLFPTTEQLIIDIKPLVDRKFKDNSLTLGISYEVINSDTNNDQKLDHTDKLTFAISRVDGSEYTEIITDYNNIVESSLNSDGNLFVVFIHQNEVYSMVVDLASFKILNKNLLPKVGDL